MKKLISAALVLAMIFSLGITAGAASNSVEKTMTYRGISIVIDGEKINPVDGAGKNVEPFIIDGTTYLPLRTVANAFGLQVGWDGATYTITLARGAEQKLADGEATATYRSETGTIYYNDIKIILDGKEITPKGAGGVVVEPFIYNDTTYLPVRAVANALGVDVKWDDATSTVSLDGEWAYLCTKMVSDLGELYKYTYGADGNVMSETATFVDGSGYTAFYTYDENGNILSYESEDEKYVWTYDERGNQLTEVYCVEGIETYRSVYEYDENGNQTAWYEAYEGGELELRELYTYNEDGLPLTYKYYYGEDSYYLYTNTYDENGNCTATIEEDYYEGELCGTTYYYSTYDENGNEIIYQYISDSFSCESLYEYDSNGNCVMINYNDSEGYSYIQEEQFDDNGVYLGYVCTYGNGDYEYETRDHDDNGDVVHTYYCYEYADGSTEWHETNYGYSDEHGEEYTVYSDGTYYSFVFAFDEFGNATYIYQDDNGEVFEETREYTYARVLI